ncbi:MAG: decaprenyl-phosphate phosphoribosyltransferase [Clostridiaceae bacterium]
MKKYIKLMRFKHYIKNGLILLPFLFGGQLFALGLLRQAALGFVSFCLLSSAVYIINDIMDVKTDREHPTKKFRPIASGEVPVKSAVILAGILLIASAVLHYFSKAVHWYGWLYLLLYLALNVGYSLGLKNRPIVDIAILVSGFLIRVLYGAALSGIEISRWMYLTVIAMSFYLGLGKRRNELIRQPDGAQRKVLRFYTRDFLDKNMYLCLALTIAFYSLWSVDPITTARIHSNGVVWTVPLVILICMSYSLRIEGNSDGDPVDVLWGDKLLLALVAILCVIWVVLIYL